MERLINELRETLGSDAVLEQEPMSKHTTFGIGGPADIFVIPQNAKETAFAVSKAKEYEIPYFVLGNGSNLLVADKGMEGMVIQIYRNMSDIQVHECEMTIQAGTLLSLAAKEALSAGLSGFEFAGGIPGTFGGAVVMNAGAYGGEMVQVLKDVSVLQKDGTVEKISASQLELGYRTSNIIQNEAIVLEGTITLHYGDQEVIKSQMDEYAQARKTKQPLEFPSAGSTFKRPKGYFAGKLIEDAGLRGLRVGGACVSKKHCGFVVNDGNATAADVMELIQKVQETVKMQTGVLLETEVKKVGRF